MSQNLRSTELMQVRVLDEDERLKTLTCHGLIATDPRAVLAIDLAKCAVMSPQHVTRSPDDLAAYCVDLSEKMYALLSKKGWTVPVPSIDELITTGRKTGF